MSDLLAQPWNHQLRFIVADSLQRIGKREEAIAQLEALEGTTFAETARVQLQALRTAAIAAPASPRPVAPPAPSMPAALPAVVPVVLRSTYQPIDDAGRGQLASPAAAARPAWIQSQYLPSSTGAGSTTAQPQYIAPSGQPVPVEPRPVPPGTLPAGAASQPATTRSAAAQNVADLYAAEKYQDAGTSGYALLQWEKPDDDLTLAIANALAWTGRLSEAITVYQRLAQGRLANEARVGMANVQRWRGRDELAVPLYREVLATDPMNASAKEGMRLAQRELRPRTSVTVGGSEDSSDVRRDIVTLNHRFRDQGGMNMVEVEMSRVAETLGTVNARQKDLTLRYHANSLPAKPRFEVSLASNGEQNLYGSVQWKVGDRDDLLEVGRVNWGKYANNPNALQSSLSALHLGAQMSAALEAGALTGRVDYYDISDDNTIFTGNVRLVSHWRPLGSSVKPFVGAEFRDAKFNSPNYWSPDGGFGSLYGGLLAEWSGPDWSFYTSGQVGARLYGDAGTSWSAAAGGKRWLSNDVGVGFNLWSMASQRNNADYRASSVNVSVEKLW
ncbi:tetratricopeptide repeat protein [Noviherbaspirillum malthae]|uniref:tetratricopeptide repeat protein n=1 Tax=Noviherbaspirillum malthae TaxID=1260987 RepID=UPI0018903E38|nr:hypothetical protein [Noviherbaspirillum malthae]